MLRELLFFNIILSPLVLSRRRHQKQKESSEELGGDLITSLRNDANLDLSMDEEYEDLRAELLAYHTALSSLSGTRVDDGSLPPEVAEAVAAEPGNNVDLDTRRSMKTTPCWKLGGICIQHKMCIGHRFLSEIPGCKDKVEVCCFTWNKFQTRDMTDKGVSNLALPWSISHPFGGKGLIRLDEVPEEIDNKKKNSNNDDADILAYDLSSIEAQKKNKGLELHENEKKHISARKQKQALIVILKQDRK
ncbi:unnamed protein product [Arctia plantaginis]|uniref:Uncharacterized protein n=1 Tax=Arctia plantaginis TaxID=874455 RepID=A0A8S1A2H4_ARCPL|nr:unnamed protein product [Arctia plantaginis]